MLKLMGLDYVIQYRKGKENRVADALSRKESEEGAIQAISGTIPEWITEIVKSYETNEHCRKLTASLTLQPTDQNHYTYKQGLIRYKGRLYIGGDR